jgi:CBS domain-containing protein
MILQKILPNSFGDVISFRKFHVANSTIMITVSSIIAHKNRLPVVILPGATVMEALQIMAEKNIGSVVVMQNGQYFGIMTERDYSRKVILKGKNSTNTRVSEIMSVDLPSVKPDDSLEYCMELMTARNIRYMPVFEDNKLTGIISMSDVVKETILSQKETISHLESYIHSNV